MTNWRLLEVLNDRSHQLCIEAVKAGSQIDVQLIGELEPATVLDFGSDRAGTIAAGLLLARICLSDLATVQLNYPNSELGFPEIQVSTDHPVQATIASQYAGWPFSSDDYFAMCSGPARMARGQESLLIGYRLLHKSERAVGIFEASSLPSSDAVSDFAQQCETGISKVTVCVARTASFPGTIQVVARSVETTMHKLHEIDFDLSHVKSAVGVAPMPPIAGDDLTALGWTNDAILYGGRVCLWVDCPDSAIAQVGEKLPSCTSPDFGRPFAEIFDQYDRDFYKIDRLLFSPAQVTINGLQSGNTFTYGHTRTDILQASFQIN